MGSNPTASAISTFTRLSLSPHENDAFHSDRTKRLMRGKMQLEELTDSDSTLDIRQKGVDMKMGLDIASLAHGKIVNQTIMIAGDSDFVPAAKLARREGIDFILDPMWHTISKSSNEHIDGIESCCPKPDAAFKK